jgi:serine protease AprX
VHDGRVKPDVVAPGARLVSLRVADSYIEEHAGPGSLAGTPYSAYRRGSGTSMATAVTSGAVALLLQRHPDWSPDRVKFALRATARKVAARSPNQVGAGLIQVQSANVAPPGLANGGLTRTLGAEDIEAARGSVHVGACEPDSGMCETCDDDPSGCPPITGDDTAHDGPGFDAYDGDEYDDGDWTEQTWYTSQWGAGLVGNSWYGNSWLGNSWLGNSWLGNSWLGSSWYGNDDPKDDYGKPARGGAWYGAWS